ncbi:hypothetical protein AB6A40_002072 [Gnathostoma spinigerum]|uniref:Mediator of RNA polymerase II transcription subunit 26 n=1 Tax=Gnathostoma spinigerum TaxID=75299 RepID=A0ABD6E5U0_9BILA
MVACAVVAVQLSHPYWMQPLSAGSAVDQLKQQLLVAVENANISEATDVISKLEKSGLTKEILEITRIGAVVNDIRKRVYDSAPELSKRCRALIKCWQKLAEPRPSSSCGSHSNSVTPNLVSPAVRRGLTPGTPVRGGRVTSSGLSSDSLSCLSSPNVTPNGSYAPVQYGRLYSPQKEIAVTAVNMHKSYSVGADLARTTVGHSAVSDEDALRNGKRKAGHMKSPNVPGLLNGSNTSKRPKCTSAVSSPAISSHHSVVAARRANVQSTSELVAELSENLPQYLAIDLSEHEEKVKREQRRLTTEAASSQNEQANSQVHAQHLLHNVHAVASSPAIASLDQSVIKKKEKRKRKINNHCVSVASTKIESTQSEKTTSMMSQMSSSEETAIDSQKATTSKTSSSSLSIPMRHGKYDWYSVLPTLDQLRHKEQTHVKPSSDPRRAYIINTRGREVGNT